MHDAMFSRVVLTHLYFCSVPPGIAKRGVCTFVQKAVAMQNAGANLAIVVNNGKDQ